MVEPIHVQALLCPSVTAGKYLATTTYQGINTHGDSLEEARRAALFVIGAHLGPYAALEQTPPRPSRQLKSIDEVTTYFAGFLPAGTRVVQDETITQKSMGRLPQWVVEFYRVESR